MRAKMRMHLRAFGAEGDKRIPPYTKQCHANKKVYLEFINAKNRAKYRTTHELEIVLYEAATRELQKLLDGKPVPSVKKIYTRIQELTKKCGV